LRFRLIPFVGSLRPEKRFSVVSNDSTFDLVIFDEAFTNVPWSGLACDASLVDRFGGGWGFQAIATSDFYQVKWESEEERNRSMMKQESLLELSGVNFLRKSYPFWTLRSGYRRV